MSLIGAAIAEKLLFIGGDIASDVLMDIYFDMKSNGKETITAEEILAIAAKWKSLKGEEIEKVKERIARSREE
jgi:hypothetical protein